MRRRSRPRDFAPSIKIHPHNELFVDACCVVPISRGTTSCCPLQQTKKQTTKTNALRGATRNIHSQDKRLMGESPQNIQRRTLVAEKDKWRGCVVAHDEKIEGLFSVLLGFRVAPPTPPTFPLLRTLGQFFFLCVSFLRFSVLFCPHKILPDDE
jgi:hypothetical protein